MAGYNRTRFVEELLERTQLDPPSFTVHLHPEHWVLNNGSKFLYHNQTASLLDDIRAHRIPVDFLDLFDAARVPFYEGCLIVELLDYRPRGGQESIPDKPEKSRAVLHPNSETMWADICNLNARYGYKWTDKDALEVEANLLLATGPKLCLDPDPHLTRIANHVIRVSTPTVPLSLKRKPPTQEPEENDAEKAKRLKLMSFMNPRSTRATPSYRLLDAISAARQNQGNPLPTSMAPPVRPVSTQPQPQPQMNQQAPIPPQPIITSAPPTQPQQAVPAPVPIAQQPPPPQPQVQYSIAPSQTPTPAPSSHTHSPPNLDSLTPTKKKEQSTPKVQFSNPAFIRAANSQTPVPAQPPQPQQAQAQAQAQQQAAHNLQFINSHPPGVQQPQGPPQPATVYPNVHAAARAVTPAQIQQIQQQAAAAQQLKIQQLKQMQVQALQSQQMAGQGQQQQGAQAQAQQLLQQQQQQQQQQQSHYRQSPKPSNPQIAAAAVQHVHQRIQQQQGQQQQQQQQTQPQAGQVPFQPPLPTQQFLQQPPAARNAAAAAALQGKMPNGTMNLNPAQARMYQAALLQQQQRQTAMQHAQPIGGRATPQMPGQQQGSPSPVRGSPVVNAATLAAARRASPMPGQQQSGQGATFMQYNPGSSHMRPPTAAGMAGSPRMQAAPSPASSAGAVEGGSVQQNGQQVQQQQQLLPGQTQHSVQSIQTMAAAAVANVPLAQREQAYQSYMYQVQMAMAARANPQQAGPYWQSMLARGMPGQGMNPAAVAAAQAQAAAAAAGQQAVSGQIPR